MYNQNNSKDEFLNKLKSDRENRRVERLKNDSITSIQALVRGFISRNKLQREIRLEIIELLDIPEVDTSDYSPVIKKATEIHNVLRRYFAININDHRIDNYIMKYLIRSIHHQEAEMNYTYLSSCKDYLKLWLYQVRVLLRKCCKHLHTLKPEIVCYMKQISNCLHLLIVFTDATKWKTNVDASEAVKTSLVLFSRSFCMHLSSNQIHSHLKVLLTHGLARVKPCFSEASLTAMVTVAFRCQDFGDKVENIIGLFCCPGLLYHVKCIAPNQEDMFINKIAISDLLIFLMDKEKRKKFKSMNGNEILFFIGNFIHLFSIYSKNAKFNIDDLKKSLIVLFKLCKNSGNGPANNSNQTWHSVLGWCNLFCNSSYLDCMPVVKKQLARLWSIPVIDILYKDLLNYNPVRVEPPQQINKGLFSKLLKSSAPAIPALLKPSSGVLASSCRSCEVYSAACLTLVQMKPDIVSGLTNKEKLLSSLWSMIGDLGGGDFGLKVIQEAFFASNSSIFHLLALVCDTSSQILTILDDIELYDTQNTFKVTLLVKITRMLNKLVYQVITTVNDDEKLKNHTTFMSVYSLLMILYERDCRRSFMLPNHWVIVEIKMSEFMRDLERNKNSSKYTLVLQYIPHVIPINQRLSLFKGYIKSEKSHFNPSKSTLITIRRTFVLEDGYRQLASLGTSDLKGVIRVKFVNQQGLDEAGIDQDGVFKEFLEDSIKLAFNPSLNLFKTTEAHKLYPSSTSHLQDNHLSLFEFVGRILAKSIYEGIVVDVNFAKFFLTQMVGRFHYAVYSSIDELPSLDPDLYKNLTYIKGCSDEELSCLGLTFSLDENYLGKLVTHNLTPGGDMIEVTGENKISYIHKMADFKMRTQIKNQRQAFLAGFRSVLQPRWLSMFSSDELQKLISGDSCDLDLADLRCHTQYFGGFHDGHRVIVWLWSILENDFQSEERGKFLKFVTSCSKGPLLGFSNMEPSFSIRCVDISEDQDTGDTIGSVIKGFLNIRGKVATTGRLPTASTCFNLLKLPNYSKRSVLRDKLRYAIDNNCGFELS